MLLDNSTICCWSSMVIIATDQCWTTFTIPWVKGPCKVVSTSIGIQPFHHRCDIASRTVVLSKLSCDYRILVSHWFDVLVPAVLIVAVVKVVAVPCSPCVVEGIIRSILDPLRQGIGVGQTSKNY